jgi:hypothetical protein
VISVDILVVTFEVGWATEDMLFSIAWARVLTSELVLFRSWTVEV